jgi:hypothetical protein
MLRQSGDCQNSSASAAADSQLGGLRLRPKTHSICASEARRTTGFVHFKLHPTANFSMH